MFCHNHVRSGRIVVLVAVAMMFLCGPAWAQRTDPFNPDKSAGTAAPQGATGVISNANFVDTPITTIFQMVSDMTSWSIVMSPEVSKQPPRINIWIKNLAPEEVLEQVMVMGGLAMERKGTTIRVMTFDEYARTFGVAQRTIQIKHAKAKNIALSLKPFAAKDDQTRILADEQSNSIVLLVPKPLIDSLVSLAESLDVPLESDKIELVVLQHLQAAAIVPDLERFLTGQQTLTNASRFAGGGQTPLTTVTGSVETAAGAEYVLRFMIEPKLNVVILRGTASDIKRATDLIAQLDKPHEITIASYEFRYVNAKDVFKTIQEIMQEGNTGTGTWSSSASTWRGMSRFKLSLAEQTNRIVAEGAPEDHAKLAKLVAAVDVALPPGTSATRVYRLTNATAAEVAKVLTDLIDDAAKDRVIRTDGERPGSALSVPSPAGPTGPSAPLAPDIPGSVADAPGMAVVARVTPVPEINAVVLRASAAEHEEFARVIKEIDKPRDQVILEVTIVTVRADNSFNLGLELGGAVMGRPSSIGFSSFGIGTPDPGTGEIRISRPPPLGLNFAVFSSDDFSLVLNALKTVGDVRVSSAPKILVQDNAVAMISQLNAEPYQSTSQSPDSTLTSLGGYVEAGTQLTVLPHIAQENWLRMDYQITMSTFGQRNAPQMAANLPPPKRETKAVGTVRVPAEHVVVLGGLVNDRQDKGEDSVPFIAEIPLLGELFKNRYNSKSRETIYIFIKPVILRDPSFQDLIYLSERDVRAAKVRRDEYPENPLKTFAPRERESDAPVPMPGTDTSGDVPSEIENSVNEERDDQTT